jgi:hypothetical protein
MDTRAGLGRQPHRGIGRQAAIGYGTAGEQYLAVRRDGLLPAAPAQRAAAKRGVITPQPQRGPVQAEEGQPGSPGGTEARAGRPPRRRRSRRSCAGTPGKRSRLPTRNARRCSRVSLSSKVQAVMAGWSVPQYLHLEAAAGRSLDRQAGQVLTGAGSPNTTCPRRACTCL